MESKPDRRAGTALKTDCTERCGLRMFCSPPNYKLLDMLEQYFTTAKELPFLHMMKNEQDQLCLGAHTFPAVQNLPIPFDNLFDCLFTTHEIMYETSYVVRVNSMCNHIAANTRRGVANLIFVQSEKEQDELLKPRNFRDNKKVIVVPWMQEHEVRVTYWNHNPDIETGAFSRCVDGGLQISPSGLAFNQNYKRYFLRGVFPPVQFPAVYVGG